MSVLQIALPSDLSVEEARTLLALKLYESGRTSLGRAAEIAGYSKRAFIEVAVRYGATLIDYPAEEVAGELETLNR